jgi:hypothetical protein
MLRTLPLATCCVVLALLFASPAAAQSPQILFVRGGPGTGGFLEGGSDEQLSDIDNYSTANGNHGWGQLADTLRALGFDPVQMTEGPAENNTPIDFANLDLSAYTIIVLGSNNADYPPEAVDAVDQFVRGGGGLLVISDANWGQNWGDAPTSDQAFLDRYGLIMNQDRGTYVLDRSDGDFVVGGVNQGDHPILVGVEAFDGEGVSPITIGDPMDDVTVRVLANAEGQVRVNDDYEGGSTRPATEGDGALVTVEAGAGRVVGHFDRNTFFNENGAGTDLTRFDNARYAKQLFGWLAGMFATAPEPPATARGIAVQGPFPNPSRDTVRFIVALTDPQHVHVEVLDAAGRQVRLVHDAALSERTLDIPTRGLPNGTYFLRMKGETFETTRPFQVVR